MASTDVSTESMSQAPSSLADVALEIVTLSGGRFLGAQYARRGTAELRPLVRPPLASVGGISREACAPTDDGIPSLPEVSSRRPRQPAPGNPAVVNGGGT
jgi:hypothetical protein